MAMRRQIVVTGIALLFIALVSQRVWRYATFEQESRELVMPREVLDEEERNLYLAPGGRYTVADIEANGSVLPSQKYLGFKATHDINPQPGDRLCPITLTKANVACIWFVGGHEYQFCCPPCIAEFVRLAKENPDQIELPDTYVKQ
jgi:hypothetical protein